MRVSHVFTKTTKNLPSNEVSRNAQLLIQAGYIYKEMAGVYAYLPYGKRVLDKIIEIIRQEMNAAGGVELSMTALQSKEVWQATDRWGDDVMDVWFKTDLKAGGQLGLAPTHEEPITKMMTQYISSYKDLPRYPYQFQIKFRNELRAKSGLMRGREFWMKDLYSFSRDRYEQQAFYEEMIKAYHKVYERLGLGDITYITFASGGSFSKYSHEFQTISEVGEDIVYLHEGKQIAINEEVYNDEVLADLGVKKEDLVQKKAVEVGNIFTLGTKFSDAYGLKYTDEDGQQKPVFMGSYGIGPSRLMGLIAEHFSDDKGLSWPEQVAPYKVYLISIGDVKAEADKLYDELKAAGVEVLYDDRNERPGVKFNDADLLGIPYRLTISQKLVDQNKLELKKRTEEEVNLLTSNQVIDKLT